MSLVMRVSTWLSKSRWVQVCRPYFQLARLDNLVGAWLLILPCLWGMALAGGADVLAFEHWSKWLFFCLGGILMRSSGCIWNDIVDRKIDRKVRRTKNRPLAKGIIKVWQAILFALLLSFLALAVLMTFNTTVIITALCSIPLVILYPFSKRWFKLPQVVLGLTFAWGIWLGWFALTAEHGLKASTDELSLIGTFVPPLLLYFSCFFWIIGYDTIYALQDLKDDAKLPIHSSAQWLGKKIFPGLFTTYALCCLLMALAALMALAPFERLPILLFFAFHLCSQAWRANSLHAASIFKSNVNAGIWVIFCLIILTT